MCQRPMRFARVGLILMTVGGMATHAEAQASDFPFTRVAVDGTPPTRPYFKMVGDLNQDGFLDIVVGGAKGPLVWYAYPKWTKTRIADGGWDGVKGEIGDVDGDGKADVVMGSETPARERASGRSPGSTRRRRMTSSWRISISMAARTWWPAISRPLAAVEMSSGSIARTVRRNGPGTPSPAHTVRV